MSDMSAGQIIGGVVGAVVGFFYAGGPAGAVQGFALGAGVGGYVDPPPGPNLRGPQLSDKSYQSTAYGVSLPDLCGTIAVMGNVFYLENNEYKATTKKEGSGGKGGGGGTYETTVYSATFAVSLGKARPGYRVRRVWAGGKLIYSAGSADLGSLIKRRSIYEKITGVEETTIFNFYDGSQTECDPRMEAVLGVGNCPSYEGTMYIFFNDFELTEYGNGLAGCPIKVEVAPPDSEIAPPFSDSKKLLAKSYPYAPAFIFDKTTGTTRPNLPRIRYILEGEVGGILRWNPGIDPEAEITGFRIRNGIFKYFSMDGISASEHDCPGINNVRDIPRGIRDIDSNADEPPYQFNFENGYQQINDKKLLFGQGGLWLNGPVYDFEGSELTASVAIAETDSGTLFFVYTNLRIVSFNSSFEIISQISMPSPNNNSKMWWHKNALYVAGIISTGIWVFDVYDSELNQLGTFSFPPTNMAAFEYYFSIDVDGIIWRCWSTHPAYGSDKSEIHMDAWLVKGVGDDIITVGSESLTSVCERIMDDCDVKSANRDLDDLDGIYVDGYRTEVGTGRSKLAPLKAAYFFETIESGYSIKAILRNVAQSGTIPHRHLVMDGESMMKTEVAPVVDLPSEYSISYIDYSREYDANVARAFYPSSYSNVRDEQLPVVLSAQKAAQTVDKFINLAWAESRKYSFKLPQIYLGVKVGDVKRVEISQGIFRFLQVESVSVGVDQLIAITARSTDPSVYDSNAAGFDVENPNESLPFQYESEPVIMDIPLVYDEFNSYGVAAAVYANIEDGSFRGAVLQGSRNSGQIFTSLETFSGVGTVGQASAANNIIDCAVIDRKTEINLNVFSGTFYSVTEAQMMEGLNYCAYGVDGRWEIIRYSNAALQTNGSINLSNLLRGLHGTEWAANLHQAGDYVVLLTDIDNRFISVDPTLLGVPVLYRSVNIGEQSSLENVEQTYRGVNLRPLSPVNLRYYVTAGNYIINFDRRSRLSSSLWVSGVEVPLGETSEIYEMDVIVDDVVVRKMSSTTDQFTYTAAQQIEDTGAAVDLFYAEIYQLSSTVGRGYPGRFEVTSIVSDPYWASVVSLQNFTDDIIDGTGRVWSAAGGAAIVGGALSINGAGATISTANSSAFQWWTQPYTIEAYVNCSVYGGDASGRAFMIGEGVYSPGNYNFWFGPRSDGKFVFGYWAGSVVNFTGSATIPTGSWTHLQMSFDGTNIRLFINGVIDLTATYSVTPTPVAGQSLRIGLNGTTRFQGSVKGVRFTKGVARNVSNFTPPTIPLPEF